MTLLYLVAAWVAGIFLTPAGKTPAGLWLALAAGSFLLAYLLPLRRLVFICAALFALGAGRYAWATHPLAENHIAHYVDTGYLTLNGIIVQDIDERDSHVNLHIQVDSVQQDDQQQPTQGVVLAQAPRYEPYAYGDRVKVSGQLLTPPEFDDFSYRDYLARRGVHAMIPNAQVEVLEHDQGQPWFAAMYALKQRAQRTINRLLPSPQAPLLSGILLGDESGISDDIREAFNRTGTTHVIAISGANIIVVIGVLMKLLKPAVGERRAGWMILVGVGIYTLFVGADPAVVRAAIMGGLALLAAQWGRRAYGLTSLAFAIWLMTLWNPLTLWDVGFQLSVAATAGLVLFADDFTQFFENVLKRGFAQDTARQITQWLSEPLVISAAAQITTLPLILIYFGRLSLVSFLANVLIVPVQAYIMTLGSLAVLLGMLWPLLGEIVAWIVWIPLTYTLDIVRSLGKLNRASTTVALSPAQAWGFYMVLVSIAFVRFQHPDDRAELFHRLRQHITAYTIIVAGVVLSILIWAVALSEPDGKLHVWFLDVGQGNAILLQTPQGAQILVDGGPNPTRLRHAVGDELPFWDRSLDVLIVSQPKAAAIDALPALLERYNVELVLTNGQQSDSESYQALKQLWEDRAIDVMPVTAGYRLETNDHVIIQVLHPQIQPSEEAEPEDAGLVLRVTYGDTSFLLTPDLSPDAEQALMDAGWYVGSTVLNLASHGSEKANPDSFLQAVAPQAAIATLGAGNRSKLPAPAVLDWLHNTPLYRTDHDGTIELVTDGHTLWIYTEN